MSENYEKQGKLSILEYIKTNNRGGKFKCKCDCGNIIFIRKTNLKNRLSCGCLRKINIVGQKFNKLTVISDFMKDGNNWSICECDCGNKKEVLSIRLKNGSTKSCGCFKPNRKKYGESSKNSVIQSYKKNANDRNLIIELSDDEIEKLLISNCFYCGEKPDRLVKIKYGYGEFVCNGIDRKDNLLGYTVNNCVSCCKTCNYMKMEMSVDKFMNHIQKIINHGKTNK
jgi:hypothetical protein